MILFTSYTPMRETKPYPNEEIKPPAKPDRLTNKELLTKAATGDQAAFAELYQKYSPDLKSFIMGKTHSQSDTEEIVQTAWQNILPKLKEININFKSYLFSTAFNVFRQRLRKKESKVGKEEYDETKHEIATGLGNLETLDQKIDKKNLVERLTKLISASAENEVNKKIIFLWLKGMPPKEISQQIGLNVNATKIRLDNMKRRLKPKLEAAGIYPDILTIFD